MNAFLLQTRGVQILSTRNGICYNNSTDEQHDNAVQQFRFSEKIREKRL